MKQLIVSFYLICFLCYSSSTTACSCFAYFSFCETISSHSIVVEAEIINLYQSNEYAKYFDVKVTDEILGTPVDNFYTVVNQGTSCDINYLQHEIGDKLILNVTFAKNDDPQANYNSFTLGGCGQYHLNQEGFRVLGLIEEDKNSEDYELFKENFLECVAYKIDTETVDQFTRIFPNPTFQSFQIRSPFLNENATIELVQYDGKKIRSFSGNPSEGIDMSDLPPGLYFVTITCGKERFTRKIVKL